MQRSENIGQLAAALALAQAKFRAIGKDKTARIASQKGAFSYTYADLATVVEATRMALTEQGLSVMQPVRLGEGQITVTSVLAHKSGEWLAEEMSWPVASADNRSIGSGITYARRHAYLALVGGAATDEDDDAESARGGDHDTQRPQPKPPAPKPLAPEHAKRAAAIWKRAQEQKFTAESFPRFVAAALGIAKPSKDWTEADMDSLEAELSAGEHIEH